MNATVQTHDQTRGGGAGWELGSQGKEIIDSGMLLCVCKSINSTPEYGLSFENIFFSFSINNVSLA